MARKGITNAGFSPDVDQTNSQAASASQNHPTTVPQSRDVEAGLTTTDRTENNNESGLERQYGGNNGPDRYYRENGPEIYYTARKNGPKTHIREQSGTMGHTRTQSGPQGRIRWSSGPVDHTRRENGQVGHNWRETGPRVEAGGYYKGHYRSKSGTVERMRESGPQDHERRRSGPQRYDRREHRPLGHDLRENGPLGHDWRENGPPWHDRITSGTLGHRRVMSGSRPPMRRENSIQSVATDLYDELKWYDAMGTRDVWVQTESIPTTVSSWKILRKTQDTDVGTSISSLSDYVVVETRSTGFEASAQTNDAHNFRFTDAQVSEMVIAWQMLTLFLPSAWYLVLYVADQVTSIIVASEMCREGEQWWCGLTITFLVLPSICINAYAYEQLRRPDISSVKPLNKWVARGLFCLQIAPHYLLGRKVSWCFRAWRAQSWPSRRVNSRTQDLAHKTPEMLWEQAKADTDSNTTKWFHSLFESVPQLSIQSYILMKLVSPHSYPTQGVVSVGLAISVAVSLISASAGLASVLSERAWERVAAATAIFLTLGSRVMVCSGIGTIHPALWFTPISAATFLGFITKLSESQDKNHLTTVTKSHKYLFEAFVMASVCPPFNAVGLFSSAPYVLAGLCYLLLDPNLFFNIVVFIMAILGQVIWLAVGFFVK